MAIVSTSKASLLKGGAKIGDSGSSITDVYIVRFDAKPADLDEVVAALMFQLSLTIGSPWKTGDSRLLKEVTPASLGTTCDFVVEFEFATPDDGSGGSSGSENPLARPDEVTVSGTSSLRPYFKDNSDEPKLVLNTAGEPFQKLPERYVGQFEIVVRGNRASLDPSTWSSYLYPASALNQAAVTIRGTTLSAGQALMKSIRSTRRTENSVTYNEVEWTIACAPDWADKIESRGFFEKKDDQLRMITADNGKDPVSMPYPLQSSGERKMYSDDDPYVIEFKPYPKKDFSIFTFSAAS